MTKQITLDETLGLTGTNVGCETSLCGACTIHMDGQSVKACTQLAVQADGRAITTIEGLATRLNYSHEKELTECIGWLFFWNSGCGELSGFLFV